MHLAIVSPFPPAITGIGQYGFHTSRSLAETNVFERISIVAGAVNDHVGYVKESGLDIEYIWSLDKSDIGIKIINQLKKIKPDVVWFNLGVSAFGKSPLANLSGFAAVRQTRQLGIPTVATLHEVVELSDLSTLRAPGGVFAKWGARLITRMAFQADVVCLTLKNYTDWLAKLDPYKKSIHIPIGSYHKPDILSAPNTDNLLFFSTFAPFKGIEFLISAFKELQQTEWPDLSLTLAGAEHHRFPGYAQMLMEKFSAVKNIHWLLAVPEDRVQSIFEQASIVVLPYSASTGSSSVLFQAASWGRPILASNLPELRSAATESGLHVNFFEANNVQSLAKQLQDMLSDSPKLKNQVIHNAERIRTIQPYNTAKHYLEAFEMAFSAVGKPAQLKNWQEA
ncbi:MAG TPA: glycosyltransferase [Anaerolineales bacterium]|nr:glycosyltransferase [Anaerolineales bacterium]